MEIYGYIYKITNTVNSKVYIGQTIRGFNERYCAAGSGIERVYKTHDRNRRAGRNYNTHLLKSIEQYGFEAFDVDESFAVAYSKDALNCLETFYIKLYRSNNPDYGYNGDTGGNEQTPNDEARKRMTKNGAENPFYGKHHSAETRAHLSAVKKGKNCGSDNPNYGNRWTEEQKRSLSKKLTGKSPHNLGMKMPREVVERQAQILREGYASGRIVHPRLGKHWDDEHKQRMSQLRKGHNTGASNWNHKPVICVTTGDVFETVNAAAEWCNISPSGISACLHGARLHAGKINGKPLEWRFLYPDNVHQKGV